VAGKRHLTQRDRELIYLYFNHGYSTRDIGKKISRDHSVVSREIKRNKSPNGKYYPFDAQKIAQMRKLDANKSNPLKDPLVLRYAKKKLQEGWSPEQIAGRIKLDMPLFSISHEAIYQYIYKKENKVLTLWVFLRNKKQRRTSKSGRKTKKALIPNRVFIDERPGHIDYRAEVGHWESDLMEGKRSSKGAVSVTTERKSRFIILSKVRSKNSEDKANALIEGMSKLPPGARKSITFDNGSENTKHELAAKELNVNTYFCHPYHSWEKGTVENSIGFVREYLPKGINMEEISQRMANLVAMKLNERPRKCLGYLTPNEVFYKELSGAFRS